MGPPSINKVFKSDFWLLQECIQAWFLWFHSLRDDKLVLSIAYNSKISEMYSTCLLKLADKLDAKKLCCKRRKRNSGKQLDKYPFSLRKRNEMLCLVVARCKLKLVCLLYMFYHYSCLGSSCKCIFYLLSISVHWIMLTLVGYDLVNHSDLT